MSCGNKKLHLMFASLVGSFRHLYFLLQDGDMDTYFLLSSSFLGHIPGLRVICLEGVIVNWVILRLVVISIIVIFLEYSAYFVFYWE